MNTLFDYLKTRRANILYDDQWNELLFIFSDVLNPVKMSHTFSPIDWRQILFYSAIFAQSFTGENILLRLITLFFPTLVVVCTNQILFFSSKVKKPFINILPCARFTTGYFDHQNVDIRASAVLGNTYACQFIIQEMIPNSFFSPDIQCAEYIMSRMILKFLSTSYHLFLSFFKYNFRFNGDWN